MTRIPLMRCLNRIASQLVLLIQKGILLPYTELPSTRSLAIDLGLHRKFILSQWRTQWDCDFSRFIKKANKLYGSRCDYASDLIKNELGKVIDFTKPQGGMVLWLKFKEDYPLSGILHKASSFGLQLAGSA